WPRARWLKLPKILLLAGLPRAKLFNGILPLVLVVEPLVLAGAPYENVCALVELPAVPAQLMPLLCLGFAVTSTNRASIITCLVGLSIVTSHLRTVSMLLLLSRKKMVLVRSSMRG